MKNFLPALFIISCLLFACKREYSFENKDVAGTLKDPALNCMNVSHSGQYKRNQNLTDSNYIMVQVRVKRRGNYSIHTNVLNGFSFRDSGYVTEGLKTLKLKSIGRPVIAQLTTFSIYFGSDTCEVTIPVAAAANDPAIYTFQGSPGKCANVTVQGNYKVKVPLVAANKALVQVNVLSTGIYSISTAVNGISYSADGFFTTTGLRQVTLQGAGIPTIAGTNNVSLISNGIECVFPVEVEPPRISILNQSDTAWSFYNGNIKFFGPFDEAYTSGATGTTFLYLKGITVSGDSAMSISIQLNRPVIDTGTYFTTTNPHFIFRDRYAMNSSIYRADPSTQNVSMKVQITSFDQVKRLIQGTFSGAAVSENGVVSITAGKFKGEVD